MKIVKNENENKIKLILSNYLKNKTKKEKSKCQENFIDLSNIESGNFFKKEKKSVPISIKSDLLVFSSKDIIYGKCRPYLDKAVIATDNGVTTTESLVYETKYPEYFLCLFHSKKFINYNVKNSFGSKMPRTSNKNVLNYELEVLEGLDFNKIGKFLFEKIKNIENIKTLISKLEKRNEYYAEKLLSGELRVRENENGEMEFYENTEWKEVKLNGKLIKIPVDWNKQLIKDIIKLQKGTSISSEDLNYENGIQYLRTNEIWQDSSKNKEEIYYNGDMSKIVTKNEDEFIICFDGYNNKPNEGTVGMVTSNGNGICSGELHKIKEIDKISRYYVNVMLLKNKRFQNLICRYGEGSTVRHSGKHFKKIEEILITYNEQLLLNEIFEKNIHEIKNLKKLIKKETKELEWLSEKLLSGEYIIED